MGSPRVLLMNEHVPVVRLVAKAVIRHCQTKPPNVNNIHSKYCSVTTMGGIKDYMTSIATTMSDSTLFFVTILRYDVPFDSFCSVC